jgi:colanic acid/amylovoran biosynthesis glycosyltransferase
MSDSVELTSSTQAPVSKPTVLMYRDCLLPYSETFILGQASHLQRYRPRYVGTTVAGELDQQIAPEARVILAEAVTQLGLWKMLYKLGGVVPRSWARQLRAVQPRLIHAHFGFDAGFALALARKLSLPLIVTGHGYDVTLDLHPEQLQPLWRHSLDFISHRGRFFRERYLRQRAEILQTADGVIAVSDFIRQQLIQRGCPAERVVTHYVGIDVEQFCPQPQVQRDPIVLFVGRLVEKKGCAYLIQAMATVQETLPHARLVIIGDGPLRSDLMALAADCLNSAEFLGRQPAETVRQWMNQATVFSVPSVVTAAGDAEGLGMVFLEAQAMGLPVVSSLSGGIPEVVIHGETGFLAPERDVQGLSDYLITLLQQPELRSQFGKAGRKRVCQHFNITTQTAQLEEIYDRIRQSAQDRRQRRS